jgi:hypothetical protein
LAYSDFSLRVRSLIVNLIGIAVTIAAFVGIVYFKE